MREDVPEGDLLLAVFAKLWKVLYDLIMSAFGSPLAEDGVQN